MYLVSAHPFQRTGVGDVVVHEPLGAAGFGA